MSKYLIKLKPIGKYFFGGDMTFEVGGKSYKDYNSKYSSYIIESNKFPQQTSLLGMLRYLLLTKSDTTVFSVDENRITNKDNAAKIIGQASFSVTEGHKLASFGKITSISPCFLLCEESKDGKLTQEYFLRAPKDFQFMISFKDSFKDSLDAYYNGNMLKVPSISYEDKKEQPDGVKKIEIVNYSSKAEFDTIYISGNDSTIKKEDEIFIKDTRIGINKSYEGKTSHDDKGYYKQVSYRLKDSFSFAFVAEVDFDLSGCQNEIVSLGADGSEFSLSASLLSDGFQTPHYPDEIKQVEGAYRVILLSDSLLDFEDIKKACFNISGSIPFRFLKTNVECENYNVLGGKIKRSEKKYYLYEKGSVFYFESEASANKFVELVEGKEEFHQIGYNYCEKK